MKPFHPARLRSVPKLDQRIYDALARRRGHPILDRVLPPLSRSADNGELWFAVAGLVAVIGGRHGRRGAWRGLVSLGAASAFVNGPAKYAVRRQRPAQGLVPRTRAIAFPTSTSFPSGHAASASAFATGMALEAPLIAIPVAVVAAAVAASRVYVGVHYPGDVMAGVAIGAALAGLSTRVWPTARDQARSLWSTTNPPSAAA